MKKNRVMMFALGLCLSAQPLMFTTSCSKDEPSGEPTIPDNPDIPDGEASTATIPTAFPSKHISKVVCQHLNWETMSPEWEKETEYIWEGDLLHEIIFTRTHSDGEKDKWGYRFSYEDGRIAKMDRLEAEGGGELQPQERGTIVYEYDDGGRLVRHSVTGSTETAAYTYPDAGRVDIAMRIGSESATYTLKWANGNLTQMGPYAYYSYTSKPNPFYFPIHFAVISDDRDEITAGIDMPHWSKDCATSMHSHSAEWQWTFGDDGYPTKMFETNGDDWKGSPIRNLYTFHYEN